MLRHARLALLGLLLVLGGLVAGRIGGRMSTAPAPQPAPAASPVAADVAAAVALREAAADRLAERMRGRTIPASFFGLHLLSVGIHGVWPNVPFGVYRTWDGVYRWHSMRPQPGSWYDWSLEQLDQLDAIVQQRAELMFTLAGGGSNGGFPEWIDPWSTDRGPIHEEWRMYVRTLAERLQGVVRYWEIWNEIDCSCFFDGPVDLLVELTDIAAAELKAVNPGNVVLSAVNSVPGSQLFDEYLRLGGAANVDIVAWHIDTPHVPERDTTSLRIMRELMRRHGLDDRPLWTTEGHARSFAGATPDEDAGILARQHLVLWSHGSEHFSWYAWDVWDYGVYDGNTHWITVTEPGRPDLVTTAGTAYGVLGEWLIGASMSSLAIDGALWQIGIERAGGYRGTIVWHAEGAPHEVRIPPGARRVRRLDGSESVARPGDTYTTTTAPVLID